MPIRRLATVFFIFICVHGLALADSLTFVAQWDPAIGATNYSWFSANNWWVSDGAGNLVPAGRVPTSSEEAIVTGSADAASSGVRVMAMTLTNAATVASGTFAVERLEVQSGATLRDARVNVLTFLQIGGTNCTLDGTIVNLLAIGSGVLSPIAPATRATLYLDRSSVVLVAGRLSLADGSEIHTLGPPQNTLVIPTGGVLASANTTRVRGSASNPLIIDNSGVILAESGTLTFEDGIDWRSGANLGEFRAATANAQLLFASPMQVPALVTSLFTGPGTSRFQAGATVDGQAQVGFADNATQYFMAGNLVVADSVNGSGTLHVLGGTNTASVLTWNNGTLSLAGINIESGAEMDFAGGSGTSRLLSGCVITNLGLCALLSPDLGLFKGASIHNEPGGVFDVRADATISGAPMPGGGEFDNDGIFRKSTPGLTTFGTIGSGLGPDFNNTGLVDLQDGRLNLCAGFNFGEFRTGGTASLWFWGGTQILNAGSAFTGAGSVRLLQGASRPTWQVTGSITSERLELGSNGTVTGFGRTSPGPIRIGQLVASDNGTLTNGSFEVVNMELRDHAALAESVLTASGSLAVLGTNCMLSGSTLNVAATATAGIGLDAAGRPASLGLAQGSGLDVAGQLTLSDGATINGEGLTQNKVTIRPGGILAATNSATVRGSAAGPLVVDNSGILQAEGGTLAFEGGIDWQSSAGTARFHAAAVPAIILFADTFQVPTGITCIFTGPGTNRLTAGGVIAGTAQVGLSSSGSTTPVPGNLEVNADLGGAGTLHILSAGAQSGGLLWNNGTLSVASVNIDSGGRVLLAGDSSAAHQLAGCQINNSGFFVWPGGQFNAGAGAVVNVLPGGTLDLQGDATVLFNNTAPRMAIRNWGTFIKSAGTGSSVIAADFANSGQFEIRTGSLEVQGGLAQDTGSTMLPVGAILTAPVFTVRGGTVSGAGVIHAIVDNGGIVAPGSPIGVLTLSPGMAFRQAPAGVLQIEIGGSAPGNQYDQIAIGGAAQLGGILDLRLVNGFVPQIGQTFSVLTCASLTGAFSATTGVPPAGTTWVPRYSSTNVTLTLAKAVTVADTFVSAGVFGLSFSTTAGFMYDVQVSDSLNPSNWRTVAIMNGDGLKKTFTDQAERPQGFYRIQIQ